MATGWPHGVRGCETPRNSIAMETEMDNPKNTTRTELSEKTRKQRSDCIVFSVTQLGTALGQKIPAERTSLYVAGLNDISLAALKYAFGEALKNLGTFLPTISELRQYASHWTPEYDAITNTQRILDRGDKPPDWEPLKPGELEALLAEVKARAEKTKP